MQELVAYKRMPIWTKETVPTEITHKHNTKVGTWGKIKVVTGEIKYEAISDENEITAIHHYRATDDIPMVEPQAWHRVTLLTDDTSFFVEFFCQPEDYFAKKYGFTRTHSEVIEALETITEPCKVLDLGCGQGRNALYLSQKGFEVTAVDHHLPSLETLLTVMEAEDLELQVGQYDIHQAHLEQSYDWIISTVVLMFLERERIPAIIENMQQQTNSGGYNLIVAAMSTDDAPCPMPFSFTFAQNELKDYYKDWKLIKYNEDFGQLHRRDENGNFLRFRFATMLAQKP
ncbi:SAM-dependent methyltransferase TehB [Streptococcus marmotae]|uniref:SAM-dependent methyltransferase TehB n=1 Tax=Streptococcus marmotae TaxID=1825069 RepID=UPI00082E9AF2|nr:SAM-dependent methyltransferase TehB [Streptococcus marmotae]